MDMRVSAFRQTAPIFLQESVVSQGEHITSVRLPGALWARGKQSS